MSDTSNTANLPSNLAYTTQSNVPPVSPKPEPPKAEGEGESPTFSQEDVDRIIQKRVAQYNDYDALKARLAEIDERDKTDLEKAESARDAALSEATKAARELSIYRAAAKHGVPSEYVDLIDGDDDAAIDAKAAKVAELAKGATPADPFASGRFTDPGQSPASAPDADALKEAFARQLFKVNPRQ